MTDAKAYIGTSGWSYPHWYGNFYPEKHKDLLGYYSEHFKTVEINNTFYQLPEKHTIENWISTVPEDFIFSVKASRYITHMKRLLDPERSTKNFFDRISTFGAKLGAILFQIPPHFPFDRERLEKFLNTLPEDYRYTLEFRDPSWFNDTTYGLLQEKNIAFCMYYMGENQTPKVVTADFIYIRYHGPSTLGAGYFNNSEISSFSEEIKSYITDSKDVYAYFNNDEAGYAVKNARELLEILH